MPTDIVAGRVIKVDAGPCYTVENDDGDLFALFGTKGDRPVVGDTVRAIFGPAPTALVTCAGRPVTIVDLEIVVG
jgi:hypothetical protein